MWRKMQKSVPVCYLSDCKRSKGERVASPKRLISHVWEAFRHLQLRIARMGPVPLGQAVLFSERMEFISLLSAFFYCFLTSCYCPNEDQEVILDLTETGQGEPWLTEGSRYPLWQWLQIRQRPGITFCFWLLTFWVKRTDCSLARGFCWETWSSFSFTCVRAHARARVCVCVCIHVCTCVCFLVTKCHFTIANENKKDH